MFTNDERRTAYFRRVQANYARAEVRRLWFHNTEAADIAYIALALYDGTIGTRNMLDRTYRRLTRAEPSKVMLIDKALVVARYYDSLRPRYIMSLQTKGFSDDAVFELASVYTKAGLARAGKLSSGEVDVRIKMIERIDRAKQLYGLR